jgi:ribosome maturation factor RimP
MNKENEYKLPPNVRTFTNNTGETIKFSLKVPLTDEAIYEDKLIAFPKKAVIVRRNNKS